MRALCSQISGFEKFMMDAKDNGLRFAVFMGRRSLNEEQLDYPVGDDEIRIAPVLVGSKAAGLFQTILGAALVVVGVVTSEFGGGSLIGLGASLALGGVMQMLSPQTAGLAGTGPDNGTSYYFNGPVNGAAQGEPVPLVYGRMRVGSKVISDGIYAQDQA